MICLLQFFSSTTNTTVFSSLDYEGDPGAQNQDLWVSWHRGRWGQQTDPKDKGKDSIHLLNAKH